MIIQVQPRCGRREIIAIPLSIGWPPGPNKISGQLTSGPEN